MDKIESGKEVSEELTRESLIAISYTAPEKEAAARNSNENLTGENVVAATKVDGNDTYRSKLISISYTESPDAKTLPVLPGKN
ncbi:unnamed protein product [Coffea canephora]|uniref:Uncharacterized protein n=1 Tax=Coffea canephora TaxID=49390 RepID=A0A068ULL5_COFCA|nr:unnamed protein product [Coffea canephora]